jgi:predicted transcriptional regulator
MTEIVESVVMRLAAVKGRWRYVAERSGVPYDTVTKIAQRKTKNPRINTITSIDSALREMERAA